MRKKNYRFFNRPFSPHLSIYQLQVSSLFSILHRFSGIILLIGFCLFIYINDIIFNLIYYKNLSLLLNINVILTLKFIYIFLSINFGYHLFNGNRFLLLNFGFFTTKRSIYIFTNFISIFFLIKVIILLCF